MVVPPQLGNSSDEPQGETDTPDGADMPDGAEMMGSGGLVTKPTLAVIAERGPEAVMPLANRRPRYS